ncbi:MAG: hypothetical protein R6X09_06000 [Bacteroidales bacterium]
MKKRIVELLVFLVIVWIYGCNSADHHMYTRISADGSCYREFRGWSMDSAFIAGDTSKNPFPVRIDSTWKMSIYGKHEGDSIMKQIDKQYYYSHIHDSAFMAYLNIRKEYSSVKNMDETFRFYNSPWDSVKPALSWDKKFRWFYTYFEFSETYPHQNPFTTIPIENYLSPEELETLYGHHTDLYKGKIGIEIRDMLNDMEGRSNAWLNRSVYEENYNFFLKNYRFLKNMPVDSVTFARAKDPVYLQFGKDTLLPDVTIKLDTVLNKHFNTRCFTSSDCMPPDLEKKYEKEFPDYAKGFGMELSYQLTMPGKVLETDAPFFNGDTLKWKLDQYRFFFTDYKLYAASRKPNYWAFAATAIIVILSTLAFLVKRK